MRSVSAGPRGRSVSVLGHVQQLHGRAAAQDHEHLLEPSEVDRGLELLRSAARKLSSSPEVQFHLGAALARKGLAAEATPVLEKVARGDASPELKNQARRELAGLAD